MAWNASPAAAGTEPQPKGGLGSSSNYYLYNAGNPIHGLVVTVKLTQDVVCDDLGFHIQLNADTADTPATHTNWRQYVMGFNPNKNGGPWLGASIEYFASPYDFNTTNLPTVYGGPLNHLPGPQTLPAGAEFTIALKYHGDNVTGADFTFLKKPGDTPKHWFIPAPPPGMPAAATAWVQEPIVAFQFVIVGRNSGDTATMQSGAGVITYTSTDAMTVESKRPPSKGAATAEKANSTYSDMPHGPRTSFTQTFGVSPSDGAKGKGEGVCKPPATWDSQNKVCTMPSRKGPPPPPHDGPHGM